MATKCDKCPLRALKIFEEFTVEELRFMNRFKVGELTIEPQTRILMEGSNAPQLYTVLAGQGTRSKKVGDDDRRQVLNFVFPGDFLGLQAGVMGEMGHTVESATSMTLCVFDRSEIWSLFKSHPDRAYDLTWLAASEEMFLGEALATIGQRSALEAVSWAMLRLLERGESLDMAQNGRMPLPFRQQDLADALGLSLVHTNKTLAKLKERGLVTWAEGRLTVHDKIALAEAAAADDRPERTRPLI
ncbi:Crp/Fnr family transcriptional regulator [Jannaschia marina]|uniref:Crp/Fnr family transcriptional regulator n=1 Tax=Jannaschia marina TaxID=2741674 RepID=UPI0015CB8A98|nr:Crp/Fnr family transcriptional regulator [Jannaschia marina]